MRYFLDTELIDDGKTIDLISIGIVAEDGREYYAESSEARADKAGDWVREHVLPHLHTCSPTEAWLFHPGCPLHIRACIASAIVAFCDPEQYGKPEFWGYYADYDWVAFCQLFGTMMDLPKGWPMYCRDIKQLCDDLGNPKLPEQGKGEHHALADARWNKQAWEFLDAKRRDYQLCAMCRERLKGYVIIGRDGAYYCTWECEQRRMTRYQDLKGIS
jgi:hypothetical protein